MLDANNQKIEVLSGNDSATRPGLVEKRSGRALEDLRVFAFLLLLGWLANYSLSSQFGVYEDDYLYTVPFLNAKWSDVAAQLRSYFSTAPEGRPLGHAINVLLTFAAGQQKSLELEYVAGWLILSINGFLVYQIARSGLGASAALVAALTYLLFPADLSKQILMHRAFAHVAVTCCLLGILIYQNGGLRSKLLSYFVAGLGLLIWEGPFLAFVSAPLLRFEKERRIWRELVIHGLIFVAILGLTLSLRFAAGEDRATQVVTGFGGSIWRMVAAVFIGPLTVAKTFVLRPIDTLWHGDWLSKSVLFLSFSTLLPMMFAFRGTGAGHRRRVLLLTLLGGCIAATFPYVLMYRQFYFPPIITIGRLSGEHIPAEFGFTIVLGSGYALLEHRLRGHWFLVLSATGYFSILAAFGTHIQKTEYVTSWNQQKEIWREIVGNSADAQEGMPILIDLEGIPRTQGFSAFWLQGEAQITLPRLVLLPPNFRRPPLVVGYSRYAQYERRGEGLLLKIPFWAQNLWPLVQDGNFIALRWQDDRLVRVDGPIVVFDTTLVPKPREQRPPWKLTKEGKQLLSDPNSNEWQFLRDQAPYPNM